MEQEVQIQFCSKLKYRLVSQQHNSGKLLRHSDLCSLQGLTLCGMTLCSSPSIPLSWPWCALWWKTMIRHLEMTLQASTHFLSAACSRVRLNKLVEGLPCITNNLSIYNVLCLFLLDSLRKHFFRVHSEVWRLSGDHQTPFLICCILLHFLRYDGSFLSSMCMYIYNIYTILVCCASHLAYKKFVQFFLTLLGLYCVLRLSSHSSFVQRWDQYSSLILICTHQDDRPG